MAPMSARSQLEMLHEKRWPEDWRVEEQDLDKQWFLRVAGTLVLPLQLLAGMTVRVVGDY